MRFISRWFPLVRFTGSQDYWQHRYRLGGDSGEGSYGEPAEYKAAILNRFVKDHQVSSVVEFGCGDGHQLSLATYPEYLGLDVSIEAIERCRARFEGVPGFRFLHLDEYSGEKADLALSLDVIFHLVEDHVYETHLRMLFGATTRYAILYTTSTKRRVRSLGHVRHRDIVADVEERFTDFERMTDVESTFPKPVQGKGDLKTCFHVYRRIDC